MMVQTPSPDIPALIAMEAAMYRLIVENVLDLIIRYDAQGRRLTVSPSSFDLLGYTPEQMLGQDSGSLVHPEDFGWANGRFRTLGPDMPKLHLTFRVLRSNGEAIWVEGHYTYLKADGGILAIVRDVTQRKHAEAALEQAYAELAAANLALGRLAQHDGLTGVVNRRRFDELLKEECDRSSRQERPLSVLLIDVDWFKRYNDTYGHLAGDACLQAVARAIGDALRRPGDEVGRFGGEEFAVLLPGTPAPAALAMAERIRAAVAECRLPHAGSPHGFISVSIGAATMGRVGHALDPLLILHDADRALYQAKARCRGTVAVAPTPTITLALAVHDT